MVELFCGESSSDNKNDPNLPLAVQAQNIGLKFREIACKWNCHRLCVSEQSRETSQLRLKDHTVRNCGTFIAYLCRATIVGRYCLQG